ALTASVTAGEAPAVAVATSDAAVGSPSSLSHGRRTTTATTTTSRASVRFTRRARPDIDDKRSRSLALCPTDIWWTQLALVLIGHVLALALAHDRALALFPRATAAVRSQYWMLAVMVGYTTLALWLLHTADTYV